MKKKVEEFKKDLKILTSKLSKIVLVMNIMEFIILPNKRININKDLYEHLKMGENKAILVLTQEEYDTILESKTCMNLSMVY